MTQVISELAKTSNEGAETSENAESAMNIKMQSNGIISLV